MTTREILPQPESAYQLLLDAARTWPDGIATQWIPDPADPTRCLAWTYADADVLANFVHEKVLASRLPAVQVQFERGETVELGPVQVDRGGLHTGDRSLPLREVQGIGFTADDLIITCAGGQRWASLKIARFPNANLFLHLVRPQLSL